LEKNHTKKNGKGKVFHASAVTRAIGTPRNLEEDRVIAMSLERGPVEGGRIGERRWEEREKITRYLPEQHSERIKNRARRALRKRKSCGSIYILQL